MSKSTRSAITSQPAGQEELIDRELEDCFFASNSASAKDCTGTVVRGPKSTGVAEAYDEVYHYKPQVVEKPKKN